MKKLFFFAAFLCAASLTTVNAQCSKTAGAKKACCAKTKAATATAVSADASIEKRVCQTSGKESYFRNTVCQTSGKVTSTEVKYDAATSTFVNVSPSRGAMPASDTAAKASCAKSCSKAAKASCAKSCSKAEKAACGMKNTKQAMNNVKAKAPAKATLMKGESSN